MQIIMLKCKVPVACKLRGVPHGVGPCRCTETELFAWRAVCNRDAWSSYEKVSATRAWRAHGGHPPVHVQGACLYGCGPGGMHASGEVRP
eukprot:359660-Chlamydomonas_euryale.AAC.21